MKKNVAVLFISGQSNAHAHGQTLKESEYIVSPLENVFSLDRNPNQTFDLSNVEWSGFTTHGKNLGESQDNTGSFAYHFAKSWQNAIERGDNLPDLYIVQISVGGQGIINGMWNRDTVRQMIPGPLGVVNIALFPLALQINHLAMKNLKQSGKNPIVIGWHWIGSEQEIHCEAYKRDDFQERYDYFFDSMLESIVEPCPLFLYKIACKKFCLQNNLPEYAVDEVNKELMRQCGRYKNATLIDVVECPLWSDNHDHNGVYAADNAHYTTDVQRWFSDKFYEYVKSKFVF